MKPSSFVAALAAACLASALGAQSNCPQQTTQRQPESMTYGPLTSCGGFAGWIGDIKITTPSAACPLTAVFTPAHDIAVPSPSKTMVQVVGQSPVTLIKFECSLDWLVILPWGTSCKVKGHSTIGTVHHLLAVPCP